MVTKKELKAFSELRGNTLLVYLCLLKSGGPLGTRQIQKRLDFSSPALATYHLDKLKELELIEKTIQGYVLVTKVEVGVLAQVVKFGSLLLPRYVFYLALFSTLFVLYLGASLFSGSSELDMNTVFAFLLGLVSVTVMAYECLRVWKQKLV